MRAATTLVDSLLHLVKMQSPLDDDCSSCCDNCLRDDPTLRHSDFPAGSKAHSCHLETSQQRAVCPAESCADIAHKHSGHLCAADLLGRQCSLHSHFPVVGNSAAEVAVAAASSSKRHAGASASSPDSSCYQLIQDLASYQARHCLLAVQHQAQEEQVRPE